MRNPALQERRNRQILADLVRAYIETGEPVSSRAISKRFEESLSTATIRNIMADLEDGGYLYQPHTSAGRVPTAAAYRFFAQEIASQATLSVEDRAWIRREFAAAQQDRAGACALVAAAGRACGGCADFSGRRDAGQSAASATDVYAAGAGRHRGILESAVLGLDAGSHSNRPADQVGDGARTLRRVVAKRAGPLRSRRAWGGRDAAVTRRGHSADCGRAGVCKPSAVARVAGSD